MVCGPGDGACGHGNGVGMVYVDLWMVYMYVDLDGV